MSKLILVSNRLPVTAEVKKNGEIAYNPSVGGLATGLSSLSKTYSCTWVGTSGLTSDGIDLRELEIAAETLVRDFQSYSVTLTQKETKLYYDGFSNKTIWPLFHYFQSYTSYDEETWQCYVSVNNKFYETLSKIYENGDLIWIHDYHLMLLPGIIRQNIPDARIGFFLHIPFPSYEVFRLLPWRKEVLSGIIGSDLIGFHTFGYVRHFLNSIQRIIGMEHSLGQIHTENRIIKCDIFPMGIDYERYSGYLANKKIVKEIKSYKDNLKNRKLILSMDRLDFTKGIVERLNAYNRFLEKYPEFHEKVQMVLLAVPSRTKVETYVSLRNRINELVGRINGKYNTLTWSPIRYLYRSLHFEMIMTLYHCADVCLVTPLRDGMNLVAKEYAAARNRSDGVLILSEMAGAAEEMGEAIIVNPNNREEVADAIAASLEMDEQEQHRRMVSMQRRLKRNDVFKWSAAFVEKLSEMKFDDDIYVHRKLMGNNLQGLIEDYHKSKMRILLMDYDGTLVQFSNAPQKAAPGADLLQILAGLSGDQRNDIVIISGRNREFLEKQFSGLRLTLISEHGAWIRPDGGNWKQVAQADTRWKSEILPLLEMYCDRTPGTFVEEKEFSLAWHYRRSDADLALMRSMEIKANLLHLVANHNLGIMEGNKVLEIKNLEINKSKITSYLLSLKEYDFIFGIGDDITDEDLFAAIPENGFTIKVGYGVTKAKYYVDDIRAVQNLLKKLIGVQ